MGAERGSAEKTHRPDDEVAQDGAGALTRQERENMNGENKTTIVNKTIKTGITFGSALAMVISYTTWHSVGWAIFHGLLSWVYVVYFVLRY